MDSIVPASCTSCWLTFFSSSENSEAMPGCLTEFDIIDVLPLQNCWRYDSPLTESERHRGLVPCDGSHYALMYQVESR
jgi:hypothetical protein